MGLTVNGVNIAESIRRSGKDSGFWTTDQINQLIWDLEHPSTITVGHREPRAGSIGQSGDSLPTLAGGTTSWPSPPPLGTGSGQQSPSFPPIVFNKGPQSMDIGTLASTVFQGWIDYRIAKGQSVPQAIYNAASSTPDSPWIPDAIEGVLYGPDENVGGPPAPTCAPTNEVWNPRANCGQGAWQKRSRRRRRQLATQSDIRDLAALKATLGNGEVFKTWIATRGR